jgi:hypothetical protein
MGSYSWRNHPSPRCRQLVKEREPMSASARGDVCLTGYTFSREPREDFFWDLNLRFARLGGCNVVFDRFIMI